MTFTTPPKPPRGAMFVSAAILTVLYASIATGDNSPATKPSFNYDYSSPKAAVISFFQASDRNDLAGVKKATVRNPKIDEMLEASSASKDAHKHYIEAVIKRFGPQENLQFDIDKMLIDNLKNQAVHERGDTADIGEHGDYPCRKVNSEWRLDLVRQQSDVGGLESGVKYYNGTAAVYEKMASQIAAGQWNNYKEVEEALSVALPRAPSPDEKK